MNSDRIENVDAVLQERPYPSVGGWVVHAAMTSVGSTGEPGWYTCRDGVWSDVAGAPVANALASALSTAVDVHLAGRKGDAGSVEVVGTLREIRIIAPHPALFLLGGIVCLAMMALSSPHSPIPHSVLGCLAATAFIFGMAGAVLGLARHSGAAA